MGVGVRWRDGYAAAVTEAGEMKRPLLIDFFDPG